MFDFSQLDKFGTSVTFKKNEIVFMQNDPGDCMYIVLSGVFGVYLNSFNDFPIRVAQIEQGSFFGEMSVIDDCPRSASVVCEADDSQLARVSKQGLAWLLAGDPAFAALLVNAVSDRAATTAQAMLTAGKEPPDLSSVISEARLGDPTELTRHLKTIVRRIRDMDTALVSDTAAKFIDGSPETNMPAKKTELLKLLPADYLPLSKEPGEFDKNYLQTHTFKCPYCGLSTQASIPMFSALQRESAALDGRVIYKGINILLYSTIVCNKCYYTDTFPEFCKTTDSNIIKPPGKYFENAEGFTGFADPFAHTPDEAALSFYLNIASLEQVTTSPLRFAKAYMRLYWLFTDGNNGTLAGNCAAKAFAYYDHCRSAGELKNSPGDLMRLHAVLGELSLLMNQKAMAAEYYELNLKIKPTADIDFHKRTMERLSELKGH